MKQAMACLGAATLIGNPIRFSETPMDYRDVPPQMGADSEAVLSDLLQPEAEELSALRDRGVV